MSMFTLSGKLVSVYTQQRNEKDDQDKIQILGDVPLDNGGVRKDLITITVSNASSFEGREGQDFDLPVRPYAPAKGTILYFLVAV